eukprot:TRINITY_DN2171_c0_g1_i2.p2 TRINITY_DN2171_c0_g1~~TRINITY_DN2171_c0_g1_i2.p2  ORF type:complete len:167 (-),score=35.90 TRINITY_DN2171_c0_g1_i2:1346-1846(-)
MSSAKASAFMNKKGFHPGTLQNREKVRLAEEEARLQNKRLQEWRREIDEEHKVEDLRRRHANREGHTREERVDFLYQPPISSERAPKQEEVPTPVEKKIDRGSLIHRKTKFDAMLSMDDLKTQVLNHRIEKSRHKKKKSKKRKSKRDKRSRKRDKKRKGQRRSSKK